MMEEKEFAEYCRMYLTSISARSAQFAYFNVFKDPSIVVLSNSTTPKKDNPEHGDRIMGFRIGELSYHFIQFKDLQFLERLKSLLHITTETVAVHVVNFFSVLKKMGEKKFSYTVDNRGNLVTIDSGDKSRLLATKVDSFHILHVIDSVYATILDVLKNPDKFHSSSSEVDKNVSYYGRVYYRFINPDTMIRADGTRVYPETMSSFRMVCMDGLTSVSIREFVKKLKKPYRFVQHVWVKYNCPQVIYEFEDDFARVLSYRPSVTNFPLPTSIKTDLFGGELGGTTDE